MKISEFSFVDTDNLEAVNFRIHVDQKNKTLKFQDLKTTETKNTNSQKFSTFKKSQNSRSLKNFIFIKPLKVPFLSNL
jgi:hypothetical protein